MWQRNNLALIGSLIALGIGGGIFFVVSSWFRAPAGSVVCFEKHCFSVALARTPDERAQGLMGVRFLPEDQGMLFLFPEENNYGFWMKDTLIPLDMIWMNADKQVVYIAHSAQPCPPMTTDGSWRCPGIDPGQPASYVLEINGGLAEKLGIKAGDQAEVGLPK